MKDQLIIFDTTLRDGEQSPGASMTKDEKIRIARALERLKVNIIEAGFPAASIGDFESVQAVANIIKESTVCGLARALDKDIDRAGEALKGAQQSRIHTFIATSPIHMKMKLNMTQEQVIEHAVKAVKRARQYTDDVEFSAEDAGRSEEDFLCRILEAVIDAGARTLNIPDTVGYSIPQQFGATIQSLIERSIETLDLGHHVSLAVELNPADLALLQNNTTFAGEEKPLWRLIADGHLLPGSVRVRADDSVVTDFVENRLESLAQSLLLEPSRWQAQSAFQPGRLSTRINSVNHIEDALPRTSQPFDQPSNDLAKDPQIFNDSMNLGEKPQEHDD